MRAFDFVSHADYWIALIPEAVLALTAIVVFMGDVFGPDGDEVPGWCQPAVVIGLLVSIAANAWLAGSTGPADALIAVDGIRTFAAFVILAGTLLVVLYAGPYLDREGLARGDFYGLTLLAAVGMMLLVAARDLILMFVAVELMSIAVYVLAGYARRNPRSSEAAIKYFLVGAFASAFLLYGIALLYGVAGTTRLPVAGPTLAAAVASGDLVLIAGIGLLVIGFGFKVGAVPFHMWTPDAYEGAPTPVTAFMATGVKAAAFVALIRVLTVDLLAAQGIWRDAIWWLAMLTMIVPNLIALSQDSVKRMLAYSSIAHAGYLLVGIAAASALGQSASLFYLAAYTVMTIGSFAIVFHVAGKGDRRVLVDDYSGLGWRRPGLGVALVIFLLSLAGFPPTAGFVGKLYLLQAAVDAGESTLAVTLVLTSLVAYYYYLRVVWKMYFDAVPDDDGAPERPSMAFRLTTGFCAALLLLVGLIPGRAVDTVRDAVERPADAVAQSE
jgi:NADH-quinone oxidoreductase subunit N